MWWLDCLLGWCLWLGSSGNPLVVGMVVSWLGVSRLLVVGVVVLMVELLVKVTMEYKRGRVSERCG